MTEVVFISNHGEMGGGERMLVSMAEIASRSVPVRVVAPCEPDEVVRAAQSRGIPVDALEARTRRQLARAIRHWATSSVGIPSIWWCNGGVPALATAGVRHPRVVHLHQAPRRGQSALLALARRQALATLVPSDTVAKSFPGSLVLENWTTEVTPVRESARHDPVPTLGYIGRLSTDKGVDVLLDAVRSLLQSGLRLRLILAGDYRFVGRAQRRRVEAALRGLGAAVEVRGWVQPLEVLSEIDLLVVPSRWSEPFGLVAAEAMAAGVPVLVSTAGALPQVVGDGYPGVFRNGDTASLAGFLRSFAQDPTQVRAWTGRNRQRWESRYSPEAGAARFSQLLGSLVPSG